MSAMPTRRALLLDLAATFGLGGPALMVLHSFDQRPPATILTIVALLAVAVALWTVWRRSAQTSSAAAIVFAVAATVVMALGDGALYYGIIWTACLMLGVTVAVRVVWIFAALLVLLVIVLHTSAGSAPAQIATEAIATAFFAGLAAAVAAVLRDSTRVSEELAAALRDLAGANAALQSRLDTDRDLVLARERERTARELHDGVGHRLTAIGLSLDYVARVDDADAARAELRNARDMVGNALDTMRRVVRAMHPVELSTLRNVEAFRAVAAAFEGTGIDIRVTIDGDDAALAHDHALLLLRFVQEGLTNVVRHANATEATLSVIVGGPADGVRAVLEDRGGTPVRDVVPGFGLRSLRARAEELGGTLEAVPGPEGVRLALALPATDGAPLPGASERALA